MAFNLYSSTDTSAPTLSAGTRTSLLNVLNACLVTGYGSKAPAGWSSPSSGSTNRFFRQPGADGVDFNIDVGTSGVRADVTVYSQQSNEFPPTETGVTRYWNVFPSTLTGQWHVFADARTVVFMCYANETSAPGWLVHVFGDIVPFNDAEKAVMVSNIGNPASSNNFPASFIRPCSPTCLQFITDLRPQFVAYKKNGIWFGENAVTPVHTSAMFRIDLNSGNSSAYLLPAYSGFMTGDGPGNFTYIEPVWLVGEQSGLLGRVRGVWFSWHTATYKNMLDNVDSLSVANYGLSRTFKHIQYIRMTSIDQTISTNYFNRSGLFVETSDTLDLP